MHESGVVDRDISVVEFFILGPCCSSYWICHLGDNIKLVSIFFGWLRVSDLNV